MNTLDIIILAIIAFCAINGLIRGFIKTLFGLSALIIVVLFTWMITPAISRAVIQQTAFDEMINEKVVELLHIEDMFQVKFDDSAAVQLLNDLSLPGNVVESLIENYTPVVMDSLKVEGIGDYIGSSVSVMAVNALVFIVVFAILSLALNAVVTLLDIVARLPVLKQMNRMGGFGIGVIIGVLVVWVGGLVLSFVISIQSTEGLTLLIESSILAKLFYYNNPLQNFIMNLQSAFN